MNNPLHFCVSENRQSDEVAVKLLILSLARHEPRAIIHLFILGLSADLIDWARARPTVILEPELFDPGAGWNIKPSVLGTLLRRGIPSVVWMDSDIIVTAPVGHYFNRLPDDVLYAAPEPFFRSRRGVPLRARDWGIKAVRDLPNGVNTSVLRVTRHHIPLLDKWESMLSEPVYQEAQKLPFGIRPLGLAGDQDVLTALLSSDLFASTEIRSLVLGRDIAQCFLDDGFGPLDRLFSIGRLPPFVHAQGPKPWRKDRLRLIYLDLSPYRYAAERFQDELNPGETNWLNKRAAVAQFFHRIGFGDASLAGLLPSTTKRLERTCRRIKNKLT